MTLRWTGKYSGSEVYEADALDVAAGLPDGCTSLAILDGPYGMGKAAWDRIPRGGSLADLYAPHFAALDRVCARSASLYVWNTAEGWACLHPRILAAGWVFRSLIVWDKEQTPAAFNPAVLWPSATEFCAHYVRGRPDWARPQGVNTNVWSLSHAAYLSEKLQAEERTSSHLWSMTSLHPSQKPLLFAERMIGASSRPGDTVWVPFGGTLREAVAAERMARADPAQARRVITCELNTDGVDYIGPAVRQADGLGMRAVNVRQGSLFG